MLIKLTKAQADILAQAITDSISYLQWEQSKGKVTTAGYNIQESVADLNAILAELQKG